MALRHLALKSRGLEETRRFYMELLGLREAFPHPGMLFLETPGGRDLVNFIEVSKPFDAEAGALDHFGLHVAPSRLAALRKRLALPNPAAQTEASSSSSERQPEKAVVAASAAAAAARGKNGR